MSNNNKYLSFQKFLEFVADGGESSGKAAKEAGLVDAAVNSARRESGGTNMATKTVQHNLNKNQNDKAVVPSYDEKGMYGDDDLPVVTKDSLVKDTIAAKTGDTVPADTLEKSGRNQANKARRQRAINKSAAKNQNQFQQKQNYISEADAARANTTNRKTEAAIKIILDYADKTQAKGRITREAILANNSSERIVQQAENLLKRMGGQPSTFGAGKFKDLVTEVGAEEALKSVQAGLNDGSIAKDRGLQAAMAEARGDIVIQKKLPKNKRRLTPEQLEQNKKADELAATKQEKADKAKQIAEAEVAKQNDLQKKIDKPSLPVRVVNNAVDIAKRNYANGNVRRALQTGGALAGGVAGVGSLISYLTSETDEQRKAREQEKLDMYR